MWKDILLLFIGALLPILTLFLERVFNLIGNVDIHSKFIADKANGRKAYVVNYNCENFLNIPLKIEIINNKNRSFIMRNLSLTLFEDDVKVADFMQGEYSILQDSKTVERVQYGDNENYSFIIEPKTVKTIKGMFFIKQTDKTLNYNKIKLSYYNGEKQVFYTLIDNVKSWNDIETPTTWIKNCKER